MTFVKVFGKYTCAVSLSATANEISDLIGHVLLPFEHFFFLSDHHHNGIKLLHRLSNISKCI